MVLAVPIKKKGPVVIHLSVVCIELERKTQTFKRLKEIFKKPVMSSPRPQILKKNTPNVVFIVWYSPCLKLIEIDLFD